MNHDEIISNYIPNKKRVVYLGDPDPILEKNIDPVFFESISYKEKEKILTLDQPPEIIILSECLELSDDPLEIISFVKNKADTVIVYEFKHYENEPSNPDWKLPWLSVGLENKLSWEFDYVNSIYLGYATLYICEGANTLSPEHGVEANIHGEQI